MKTFMEAVQDGCLQLVSILRRLHVIYFPRNIRRRIYVVSNTPEQTFLPWSRDFSCIDLFTFLPANKASS